MVTRRGSTLECPFLCPVTATAERGPSYFEAVTSVALADVGARLTALPPHSFDVRRPQP
jgi:hypothetical protein